MFAVKSLCLQISRSANLAGAMQHGAARIVPGTTDLPRRCRKSADKCAADDEEQPPKSIGESVNRNLQYGEGEFSWHGGSDAGGQVRVIPTAGKFDGVRSFAEQVKHVDCAIRLLQRIRRQEAAPTAKMGPDPARTRRS